MLEINQLYLGACEDLLPQVASKSIDLIISDLPYLSSSCPWDCEISLTFLWEEYRRICKDVSTVVMFGTQPFTSALVMSNVKAFRHSWVWEKDKGANFAHVKRGPFKEHEDILVFRPNKVNKYFPIMEARRGNGVNLVGTEYTPNLNPKDGNVMGPRLKQGKTNTISELRYPRSIQRFNRDTGLHPTQKSLKLIMYLVNTYSEEGDVVLDHVMGSGTTCLAAKNLNRGYIGIEKDEKFYNIAKQRIASVTP